MIKHITQANVLQSNESRLGGRVMGIMDPIENTFCISITYVLHVKTHTLQ